MHDCISKLQYVSLSRTISPNNYIQPWTKLKVGISEDREILKMKAL